MLKKKSEAPFEIGVSLCESAAKAGLLGLLSASLFFTDPALAFKVNVDHFSFFVESLVYLSYQLLV